MGKQNGVSAPLTQEDLIKMYQEAKQNPLSRDIPSTLTEVNTKGYATSTESLDQANTKTEGNYSPDKLYEQFTRKSPDEIQLEKKAKEALEKEVSYLPKDYSEEVAKELYNKEDYTALKDLKKEKEVLLQSDPSYSERLKEGEKALTEKPWYEKLVTGGYAEQAVTALGQWVLNEETGMSKENAEKLKDINNKIYAKTLPALTEIKTRLEKRLRDSNFAQLEFEASEEGQATFAHERGKFKMARNKIEEHIESVNAVINKGDGWQAVVDNIDRDLATGGIYGMVQDVIFTLPVLLKAEKGSQLSAGDEALYKATALTESVAASEDMQQSRGYRILDGTMKTIPFLAQMAATSGIGSVGQKAGQFTAKKMLTSGVASKVASGLSKIPHVSATALGVTKKTSAIVGGVASVGLQTAAMPMTYSNMMDRYKGVMEADFDENGSITQVYFRDDLYNKTKKEYSVLAEADRQELALLNKEGDDANSERKLELEARLGLSNEAPGVMSYEDMLGKIKPISALKAARMGFFDTANELITEKFAGKFIDASLARIPYMKQAKNTFTNTKAGRIYKNVQEGTSKFSGTIGLDSMPAEYLEEIVIAPLNALNQGSMDEIYALGSADTHIDILGQTALMGIGFRLIGGGMSLPSRVTNPEFYKNRKELRKKLSDLRKASTDDQVNNIVDLTTPKSGLTIGQQKLKVQELRNLGKKEEADKLEQRMFYDLAMKSFQTNTSDEFINSLNSISENTNLSETTRLNAELAKEDINKVKKVYDNYRNLPNVGSLVQLQSNKVIGKRTIKDLEAQMIPLATDVTEAIDALIKSKNLDVDYNLDDLYDRTFLDKAEKDKYNSFLQELDNAQIPAVAAYDYHRTVKNEIEATVNDSMIEFNKQLNPETIKAQKEFNELRTAVATNLKNRGTKYALEEVNIEEAFRDAIQYKSIGKNLKPSEVKALKEEFKKNLNIDQVEKAEAEKEVIINNVPIVNQEPVIESPEEVEPVLAQNINDNVQAINNAFIINDSVLDNFDDLPNSVESFDAGKREIAKNGVASIFEALEKANQKSPDFKTFMHHLLKYAPKEMVEENYNAYKLGWQENNYVKTDFNSIYNELFDPLKEVTEDTLKSIASLFETTASEQKEAAKEFNEVQKEHIEKVNAPIVGFTDQNIPIKAVTGERISIADTKLGYNAIRYVEVLDAEGNWKKKQSQDARLNMDEDSIIDFSDLLNPDKYQKGSTFSVAVSPEEMWPKIQMNVGKDQDGKSIVMFFSEWLKNKELENPNFRDTKEFNDKVPIFALNEKGVPMAYIHDVDWYNPYNVGDPISETGKVDLQNISTPHMKLIQAGKDNVSALRDSIINGGVSTLKVSNKKEGAFYEIELPNPEISLAEANPQLILAVQIEDQIFTERGVPFENDKRILLNDKKSFQKIDEKGKYVSNGHTWDIRRIGVDETTGKETWRAFPVTRKNEDGQAGIQKKAHETLKWLWAAQARLNLSNVNVKDIYDKNVMGTPYEMSEEKANEIVEKTLETTGISIKIPNLAVKLFNLYGSPQKNMFSLATFGNTLYKQPETAFRQTSSLDFLKDSKSMIEIDEQGNITDLELSYPEYLKSILTTNIKSFNVGTKEAPVYATSIQPVLTFSVAEEQKKVSPDFNTRVKEEIVIVEPKISEPSSEAQEADIESDIAEAERLLQDIGFSLTEDVDELPSQISSLDKLKNIFNVSPGLSILQESQIVDYVFNNLLTSIDIKYKAKVNKRILLNELKGSYDAITGPSKQQIENVLPKLKALYNSNPSQQERLSKLIKDYKNALEVFESINSNWQSIENKAIAKVSKYTGISESIDSEAVEEADMSLREKDYNKSTLEENGKQKTSYRLRRFMAGIQRYAPNGNVKKGFLGLPTYIGFNDVYNSISQYFGTGIDVQSDYNSMLAKLKDMQESELWVKELIDKLEASDEQMKKGFVYNYTKHALQMKFAMYSTGKNGTTLKIFDTNANEITRLIRDKWKNNFLTSKLTDQSKDTFSINKAYAQKLMEQYASWGNEKHLVEDSVIKGWLSDFGLNLSDQTFDQLKEGTFYYQGKYMTYNSQFYGSKGLMSLLNKYLGEIANNKDSVIEFEENEKNHPFTDIQGLLSALSKVEARYTPQAMTTSFRDGGKQISGQVPTKFVTDRINDLKRDVLSGENTLIDQLSNLSISKNSILLDLLKNEPGFAEKLDISHNGITALKQLGRTSNNFSSITDLNSLDHDIAKLAGFQDTQQGTLKRRYKGFGMRMANMFLPTMSDKSQMLMLKTGIFDFMGESELAFVTNEEGKLTLSTYTKELLYDQLVTPELKRIINFHQNVKATNVVGYDLAAQMFNFIPELNNVVDDKGIKLIKYLAVSENINEEYVKENFYDAIMDVVSNTIDVLVEEKTDLWRDSFLENNTDGSIKSIKLFDKKYADSGKGDLNNRFNLGAYDFVMNSMISNVNSFTMIAGDPALYSQDKLFSKLPLDIQKIRNIAANYGKENLFLDHYNNISEFNEALVKLSAENLISDNLVKDMQVNIKPLPYEAKDPSFYSDTSKKIGTNIGKRLALLIAPGNKIANSLGEEYIQLFAKDAVDISENSEYLISLFYGAEGKEKALPILAAYKENKDVKNTGKILSGMFPKLADYFDIESTDAQEYTTLWEHINILQNQERISDEQMERIKDAILKEKDLTKEDLNLVMQPIKPVHTGQVYDPEQDIMRTVYIKSSSFPLIPQLTAGTQLDKVRFKMEEIEGKNGKPVRLSYQTANKVGAMSNAKNIFTDELDSIEETALILSRDNFRIQQDIPFKSDLNKEDKVSLGTQIFKLLFGDGVKKLNGFNYKGETKTGVELHTEYTKTFMGLVDIQKNKLFRELGLNQDGSPIDATQSILKLQDLLKSEAENRGYPIQDIKGLELEEKTDVNGNTYHEFKIPLWLSTNSNRYESLLNSIISNRIMSYKVPGNSFVAGSESGFARLDTLENIDKSRIIRLSNWNGQELQGAKKVDGKMQAAQVLVPSKFKDTEGNLINLFEKKDNDYIYLSRNEDGSLRLKENMIDPKLLMNFSFRTPTSSHVSGSNIEIVGILPPEVGDLLVVPKNFTKQKGLDYDIDKETAYQFNHILENNGRISKLSEEHKETRLQGLVEALKKEEVLKNSPEERLMKALLGDLYDDAVQESITSIQEKIDLVNEKFNEKLLQNDFIELHMSVYSNPDQAVQQKINKVLSMQFASEQADMIEGLTDVQSVTPFTILSDEYQKQKMSLGAAGKLAIGVYSNYVTFHGLIQQADKPIQLQEKEGDEIVNKSITIGKLTSDGILGKVNTLDGSRSVAEAFAERQNTATDNEKEQILGRVNVNSYTINVDSLITALGFDKDENENSISYTLLSQPVIKSFVNKMNSGKGISADYVKDLKDKVILDLVRDLSGGSLGYSNGSLYDKTTFEDIDYSDLLTGDNLIKGIKNVSHDSKVQLGALTKFLQLDEYARSISKIQSVLNTDNLGKSMIESSINFEQLSTLPNNLKVANAFSLLGEFLPIDNNTKKPEGWYTIGNFYMKPTTAQGSIVIEGLRLGNTLWKDYFPYTDKIFNSIVEETLLVSNVDRESTFKEIEARQEVMREVKKYLYSRRKNGIFTSNVKVERERLFMNPKTNLANYLNDLTNVGKKFEGFSKGITSIKSNRLLNKFSYDIGIEGEPSLVKFNNTSNDNFDEEYLYNSFPELIIEDLPLPDLNGKPYSTRELAQDLITYAYIEGGVQEAIQFIKYVPVEYLESVGVTENGRFVSASNVLQSYNAKRRPDIFKNILGFKTVTENTTHIFTKQYIQHSPEKATQLSKDQQKLMSFSEPGKTFILNQEERPKFISVKNSTKSKKIQNKFNLYEHVGNGEYSRIAILGTHGMSEYQYNEENAGSLIDKVSTEIVKNPSVKKGVVNLTNPFNITAASTTSEVLEKISNTQFDTYKNLSETAKVLLPMLKDSTSIKIVKGLSAAGRYNRKEDSVYIDVDNTLTKGAEATARTLLHETVHSVTSAELRKYYETDGNTLKTDVQIPNYVTNLHLVFNEFKKQIDPIQLEIFKQKLEAKRKNDPNAGDFLEGDIELLYGATSIFEFVTTALTEPMFQEKMSKIPYKKSGLNIVEKFREAVLKILQVLNPDIKSGSLAEASILETLNFIQEETAIRQKKNTFDGYDPDSPTIEDLGFDPDTEQREGPSDVDLIPENTINNLPDCI